MNFALTVNNLRVHYFTQFGNVKAVDDVSFTVGKNESIGIVGESGCGKSTLGAALLRSVPFPGKIVDGQIILDTRDITNISDDEFDKTIRWKEISMIFQGALNSLDPVFTVGSQMREILKQHGYPRDDIDVISHSLKSVLLEPTITRKYPHELSGGMKQRVAIAMALLLNPKILIADEPTTSLDVMVQSQIINLLKKLKRDRNMSIVFISHDLGVISEVSETIAIMYRGQIVEFGKSYEIYKNPKHPYTEKLVKSIPSIKNKENLPQKPDRKSEGSERLEKSESSEHSIGKDMGCKYFDNCPYAKEKCRNDPPLINDKNGFVRCWLYE
ncbi:MAG TPA: ABC transporter ATP-binding protein [Nitrososphaeraceae archaeon]|nr:ABC transporter ATP-binding protein [Nitrososphaeraceae archaeon]